MKEARVEGFAARLRTRVQVVHTGFVALFAVSTATAAVTVDQSPLFVQQTLPPNIVLMFDDSGSMDWDYMPDWDYLTSTSDDSLRNSSINGTYYSPSVNYAPPPTRSEEHTSELQSLMRISYAVFCLKKKNKNTTYKY